jgi:hypothetical protein
VYLATDKSDHEKTLAFKKIVSAHMRVIEYKDLRLDNCEHMIPSILEQAIAARISGHYIGTFPSSWDEMVYITSGIAQGNLIVETKNAKHC